MKIAIITDTHFGARKGSKNLHDYFELFYKNVFFPKLEEYGIDTIIHMGDVFDSRKAIDLQTLEWSNRVVFEPLKKYKVYAATGNHDAYYKNTNFVNSPELLLTSHTNWEIYSSAKEIQVGGLDILLLPWITTENYEHTLDVIKTSKSKVAMGHLELNGFRATRGHMMETGMDVSVFDKFDTVFSGHFHTRSNDGKIFYLGNPYEMFWNDVNDKRGFHIFDTETLELLEINNPYKLFYNIYYEDTNHRIFNTSQYENKIVKVIVRKKTDPKEFEKFIDKLFNAGVQDLKIIENFAIAENEEFEVEEDENTISILNRYIDEAEMKFDKTIVKDIFRDLYRQACEVQ